MDVRSISLNSLLKRWHWLCSDEYELLDMDEFGDLFLQSGDGPVLMLDIHRGELKELSNSVPHLEVDHQQEEGISNPFLPRIADQVGGAGQLSNPRKLYGYKVRPFTVEGVQHEAIVYVADLYEYLSYIAELECQLGNLPEGTKVKVVVKKSKSNA